MANPQPTRPNSTPQDAPPCDPQLPELALAYRMNHQLMSADDFGRYNVTVWRLENAGNVEYVPAHNETIKELEKKHRRDPENPATVGLHSEVFVSEELRRRRDVLSGEAVVTQIFTERIPCSECRKLLLWIPQFRNVPRYYYLAYHDKKWQVEQGGGKWAVFLMNCYRLRTTDDSAFISAPGFVESVEIRVSVSAWNKLDIKADVFARPACLFGFPEFGVPCRISGMRGRRSQMRQRIRPPFKASKRRQA